MLKSASRARSEVGLAPSGTTSRRPFHLPAMMRTDGLFLGFKVQFNVQSSKFKEDGLRLEHWALNHSSVGGRELKTQLFDLLELAVRLGQAFELDDPLLRDELLDAENISVEPLQQRPRRQEIRSEPRGGRERS